MQKVNVFVFITILLIEIQANESFEFDIIHLLRLHNEERSKRGIDDLILNPNMNLNATELANELLRSTEIFVSELYGRYLYRFDQTDSFLEYVVNPDMVFEKWLMEEVFVTENNDIIDIPSKIIYKFAKEIGIGYAHEGHVTTVVALYSINDNMSSTQLNTHLNTQ